VCVCSCVCARVCACMCDKHHSVRMCVCDLKHSSSLQTATPSVPFNKNRICWYHRAIYFLCILEPGVRRKNAWMCVCVCDVPRGLFLSSLYHLFIISLSSLSKMTQKWLESLLGAARVWVEGQSPYFLVADARDRVGEYMLQESLSRHRLRLHTTSCLL